MASGVPALITLSISHFCEKARWALDRCGVQFSEEAHAPVPHRFACRAAGGRGTVPCLRLPASASARGTATCVDQSTPIARWADERRPAGAAPLFPAGDTGAEVERLCHECDRSLGPAVRLWAYSHLLNTDLVADAMAGPPVPAAERVAMRAGGWWLVRRLMARVRGNAVGQPVCSGACRLCSPSSWDYPTALLSSVALPCLPCPGCRAWESTATPARQR